MNLQAKRKAAQNAVYILSAIIVAAVMVMTLVTSVMKLNERVDEPPVSDAAETEPYAKAPVVTELPAADTDFADTDVDAGISELGDAEISAQTPEIDEQDVSSENMPVFVMPCSGIITRGYDDTIPVWSQTMDDYRIHTAIDISAVYGYEAKACADGVITAVSDDPYYGVTVVIDHGDGLISRCSGLSQTTLEYVKSGRAVKAGDLIGAIGESAGVEMSDEPHIHLSMSLNGTPVNPLAYIPYDESEAVMAYEDEQ